MSDSGNYLAEMLQAGKSSGTDVIGNLNRGMEFGQNIQDIPMQNMFRQQKMQQMEKQKQVDAAIKQYGQTGDIKGLQAIDPMIAAQAAKSMDYLKSRPPEYIQDLESAMGEAQRVGPMITKDNWSGPTGMRSRFLKAHPKIDPNDLPPDGATDDQLYKWKYGIPLVNATIEGMKKSYEPYNLQPGAQRMQGSNVIAENPNKPVGMQPTQLVGPQGQMGPVIPAGTHVHQMPNQQYDIWENPQNPTEAGYFTKGINPGQQGGPPSGWVPQKQIMGMVKEEKKQETHGSIAQMLIKNEMNPDMVSGRGMDKNDIIADAKKLDPSYDPAKQKMYWFDAQKRLAALDSTQMQKMETGGLRVIHTADEIKDLSNQLNGAKSKFDDVAKTAPANLRIGGVGPLNRAKLDYYIKLRGNTPEGILATKYVTAVNDMKDLIASNATGGYAPTDPAWKLANEQMDKNFGVAQMGAAVDELKKLVEININAGRQLRGAVIEGPTQTGPGQYQTPMPYQAPAPAGGGGQQSGAATPPLSGGDYYNTFKQALSGPHRQQAIDFAKKNYPQYLEQAKKEGAL